MAVQNTPTDIDTEVEVPADLTNFLQDVRLSDGYRAMVKVLGVSHGLWFLDKEDVLTPVNGTTVVATMSGVGRWKFLTMGGAGACPWTRAGAIVTLSQTGDNTVQPFDNATTQLGSLTNRWGQVVAAAPGFLTFSAVGPNPTSSLTNNAVAFGPGGAAILDVGFLRVAPATLDLSDGGVGAGTLQPHADNAGALGAANHRWNQIIASGTTLTSGFIVYGTSGDLQPTARLGGPTAASGGYLALGPGGATVPDTRIHRTAAVGGLPTLRADDNAGLGVNFFPGVDNVGSIGDAQNRWQLVRAVTITSGDVCFDDQACQICGNPFEEGDDLVLRVIRIEPDGDTGRRLTRTVPAHHGCK